MPPWHSPTAAPNVHPLLRFRAGSRVAIAVALAVIGILLSTTRPTHAAEIPLTLEQLTRASAHVIVADVAETSPRLEGRFVMTDVLLRNADVLKGQGVTTLTVPGGQLGDLVTHVSSTPTLKRGERVVLFLDDKGRVIGGPQGKAAVRNGTVPSLRRSLSEIEAFVSIIERPQPRIRKMFPEVFTDRSAYEPTSETTQPGDEPVGVASQSDSSIGIAHVSPDEAPAGVGAPVVITGSGFGTSAGRVEFFHAPGAARVAGTILSWSPTRVEVRIDAPSTSSDKRNPSSGPLRLTTQDGRWAESPLRVTFATRLLRWGSPSATYRLGQGASSYSSAIAAAAATLTSQTPFSLTHSTSSANEVLWENLGTSGPTARAWYSFYESTGEIVRASVEFNADRSWGTGSGGTLDVESVALHELGHWFNLRDLYGADDVGKAMYGVIMAGHQRRSFSQADIDGVRWLYHNNTLPVSPPSRPVPTTSVSAPTGWVSSASVSITSSDPTGVRAQRYRLGSSAPHSYTSPFTISTEGVTTIHYWAVNQLGIPSAAKSVQVRVDRTPPVSQVSIAPRPAGGAWVTINAHDAHSGVATTRMRLNSAAEQVASQTTVTAPGTHTVQFRSIDAAGNTEAWNSSTFVIDEAGELIDATPAVVRLSGSDRYATALAICQANFADGSAPTTILANGAGFADALTAAGLAGVYDAPLLLAGGASPSSALRAELDRLGTRRVILVGGTSAIPASVAASLADAGYAVERIAGADRYATAAAVAHEVAKDERFAGRVFIARGDDYADALAAAPYSFRQRMPIVLTAPGSLTASASDALRAIGADHATVIGGTGALTQGTDSAIQNLGITTERVAGGNRYATATALVRHARAMDWYTPRILGLATGSNFPDALGGGVSMGAVGGAVVLTPSTTLCAEASQLLSELDDTLWLVQVFGGPSAVCTTIESAVSAMIVE